MAGTESSARFATVSAQRLEQLVSDAVPKNTKRTTKFWIGVFERYCAEKRIDIDLRTCTAAELGSVVQYYYVEARNKEGETYQRSSLRSMRAAIHRRLKELDRHINIYSQPEFLSANKVFTANLKHLHKTGQLRATVHKTPLDEEDLDTTLQYLYRNQDDPIGLCYGAWFFITLHLGLRGIEVQCRLERSDFDVLTDRDGNQTIKLSTAFATKNHQADAEEVSTGVIAHPTQVRIVLKLFSLVNPGCSRIFQRANPLFKKPGEPWFHQQPLGHNTLQNIMKRISIAAHLPRIYTNHCVRATTCSLLKRSGFSDREVASVSGHKDLRSLQSYDQPTAEDRRGMAAALDDRARRPSVQRAGPAPTAPPAISPAPVFDLGVPDTSMSASFSEQSPCRAIIPVSDPSPCRAIIPAAATRDVSSPQLPQLTTSEIDALVAVEEAHTLQHSLFDCGSATFTNCTFNIVFKK